MRKADTPLPPSCAVVMKSGNLNFLEPSGPHQACNGFALPFYLGVVRAGESRQFLICDQQPVYSSNKIYCVEGQSCFVCDRDNTVISRLELCIILTRYKRNT